MASLTTGGGSGEEGCQLDRDGHDGCTRAALASEELPNRPVAIPESESGSDDLRRAGDGEDESDNPFYDAAIGAAENTFGMGN